ncbi:hypothetical protein CBS101457_000764 [Exobasidium rhododendri]|nr:hypothetical protein CBS101457_000764 [Exobasidium rhododendri]
MEDRIFQSLPQTVSATSPFALHNNGKDMHFQARRKRTRKTTPSSSETQITPAKTASASSWGVADDSDAAYGSSESEKEAELVQQYSPRQHHQHHYSTGSDEHKRKRRHLEFDDDGRFASMSIDHTVPYHSSLHDINAPSQATPPSETPTKAGIQEIKPSSIEEPDQREDGNDSDMRVRRGPTTLELEKNRFYVSSLSDDSSDEEDHGARADQDQVDAVLSSGPIEVQQDGTLRVNGELIDRLQALESQRQLTLNQTRIAPLARRESRDCEESGYPTPTSQKGQNALTLWRKPEDFTLNFGLQGTSWANTMSPLVVEEGGYAYVPRHPPATTIMPMETTKNANSTPPDDDAMEIDD